MQHFFLNAAMGVIPLISVNDPSCFLYAIIDDSGKGADSYGNKAGEMEKEQQTMDDTCNV